jgi:uncharacterized protein (DUF4415 family)
MTLDEMRAARERGESLTDWEHVRRTIDADPEAVESNRKIGELIEKIQARKRGRPLEGEPKVAVSLRVPESVLAAFRAGGAGWQTRMNMALKEWIKTHSPG